MKCESNPALHNTQWLEASPKEGGGTLCASITGGGGITPLCRLIQNLGLNDNI